MHEIMQTFNLFVGRGGPQGFVRKLQGISQSVHTSKEVECLEVGFVLSRFKALGLSIHRGCCVVRQKEKLADKRVDLF